MIEFINVDEKLKSEWMNYSEIRKEVNEQVINLKNGYSIIAKVNNQMAGIISVYYKNLINPINETLEAYIDLIEVRKEFRNKGIATQLINEVIKRTKENKDIYQIRAWSSEDKVEMINLWKKLKFTLNPAETHPGGKRVLGYFVGKVL